MFIKVKVGLHRPQIRTGRTLTGAIQNGPSHLCNTISFSPLCECGTSMIGEQSGAILEAQ